MSCTPNKQINIAWSRWPRKERVAGVTPPPYHPFTSRATSARDEWEKKGRGGEERRGEERRGGSRGEGWARSGLTLLSFACRSILANAQHPKKITTLTLSPAFTSCAINGAVSINLG